LAEIIQNDKISLADLVFSFAKGSARGTDTLNSSDPWRAWMETVEWSVYSYWLKSEIGLVLSW